MYVVGFLVSVVFLTASAGAFFAGLLTSQTGTAGRLERRARGWSEEKATKIMWTGGILVVLSTISMIFFLYHLGLLGMF